MSKFILINSPVFWDSSKEDDDYLSPLGQGYIATQLEKEGLEVELLDAVKGRMSVENILNYVKINNPQYVGINIFTQNYSIVKHIVENVEFSGSVFVGGSAAKFLVEDILGWSCKNNCYIIIGEGEYIIPSICKHDCREQPTRIYNNKFVYCVTKDSIYFPADISSEKLDRKFFSNELSLNHYGEKEAAIISSRGCVFDCAFCGGARSLNTDTIPRIRNELSIVSEIQYIRDLYPDVASIRVLDDLFLRNQESFELAIRVFAHFHRLRWRGMAHVLPVKQSVDKLEDLRKSGCSELFIGIESGSEKIREYINKLGSCKDILDVSRCILEHGIDLKGYFIFGFPGETENDYLATYELASEIKNISSTTEGNFRTSVFQFRPYHGTRLYNELVKKNGMIQECIPNERINDAIGRSQFNFMSGNYSATDDDILYQYITKTQNL